MTFRAIVASYIGVCVYAALVFVGAWRLAYWQGVLYLGLALVGTTLNHVLMPAGSTLTAERVSGAHAGQDWDKRLLGLIFLVNAVGFIVAGMDSGRFGWTGPVSVGVTVAGSALMLGGQVLFAMAKRENAFFSSTVRIFTPFAGRVSSIVARAGVDGIGAAATIDRVVARSADQRVGRARTRDRDRRAQGRRVDVLEIGDVGRIRRGRSEEHTSELQSH